MNLIITIDLNFAESVLNIIKKPTKKKEYIEINEINFSKFISLLKKKYKIIKLLSLKSNLSLLLVA